MKHYPHLNIPVVSKYGRTYLCFDAEGMDRLCCWVTLLREKFETNGRMAFSTPLHVDVSQVMDVSFVGTCTCTLILVYRCTCQCT